MASVDTTVLAGNSFTNWLTIGRDLSPGSIHRFSVHAYGASAGATKTTAQYKRPWQPDAEAVDDPETIDGAGLLIGILIGVWQVRAGVKTGDFDGIATVVVATE